MSQPPRHGEPDSDKRLELSYDGGKDRLKSQDTTLGNIRTRANSLLATSALLTSLSSGVGLINTDPTKGPVLSNTGAWALLIVTVIIGVAVISTLWPVKNWVFGPSAERIMSKVDQGTSEDEIRRYVIEKMIDGIKTNENHLKIKQLSFEGAAILLLAQVVILVAALAKWI